MPPYSNPQEKGPLMKRYYLRYGTASHPPFLTGAYIAMRTPTCMMFKTGRSARRSESREEEDGLQIAVHTVLARALSRALG